MKVEVIQVFCRSNQEALTGVSCLAFGNPIRGEAKPYLEKLPSLTVLLPLRPPSSKDRPGR